MSPWTSSLRSARQVMLISGTLAASWLGMQWVHEAGHAAAAVGTGARVEQVVLHPLSISRTDVSQNRQPLIVVWAGPMIGVLLPLLFWGAARTICPRQAFVFRFFAGFCLIANGAYLAVGSFAGIGDCGVMLRHGTPVWALWFFGMMTVPAGLWLWHGQGPQFGLAPGPILVDRPASIGVIAFTVVLALAGWLKGCH